MIDGVKLDDETADRITSLVLRDHLRFLQEIVDEHLVDGKYMHPEDLEWNKKIIEALEVLTENYFTEVYS